MKNRGVFEKVPGSGVWWVQYFDNGRRRREKVGSKSAAIALVEKRRTIVREGGKLPEKLRARPLTVNELADVALTYSRKHKLSYKADMSRMKNVIERFGNMSAESVRLTDVEDWLDGHKEWTLATKNRHIALLKLMYRLGERAGKIRQNPMRLLRQPKENNERIRFLTAPEEAALRQVITDFYPQHLPELEIALHTGMRASEQYGMTWEQIDILNGIITVPRSKHGQVRYVHLNSHARKILLALHSVSSGSGRVFHCRSPRHWFEPAIQQAGIKDFTWHCLRHTFCSRLVMSGVDLRTVQQLMGHKTIQMTCRYAHLALAHESAAVEKLVVPRKPSATTSATGPVGRVESSANDYPETAERKVV